jgi:hypothetical protein
VMKGLKRRMRRNKQRRDLEPVMALVERPLTLDDAYVALQESINSAVAWYLHKKASKRRWARALRLTTIVALVLGGLTPIISGLFPALPSSVGFVLLGLAAGMQLFDRSFGLSGGWSRNLNAAMSLEACGAKLALEFSRLKSRSAESDKMWQLLIAASNETWHIIGSETSTWHAEFETALEDIRSQVAVRQSDSSLNAAAADTARR